MKKRKIIQSICTVLYNCYLPGFFNGHIYRGNFKVGCIPGLNCYSCPGAVSSCPLGSLQGALISIKYKFPYYVLGILFLFGVLFGRIVCGFLCPFGLIQELLYKIPSVKIKKGRWSTLLSKIKYMILLVFVLIFPVFFMAPGFCKYICPIGTLEAGIPLIIVKDELKELIGGLFVWKVVVMIVILMSAIVIFRSFCRFFCPLGAFYSFFHKISFIGMEVNEKKCTSCNACVSYCKMDIKKVGDKECIGCGECMTQCHVSALRFRNGLKK
nr:4Fe-4S binding protein [uncultured Sellimonas sp.]